jgi:hypothetical protein
MMKAEFVMAGGANLSQTAGGGDIRIWITAEMMINWGNPAILPLSTIHPTFYGRV